MSYVRETANVEDCNRNDIPKRLWNLNLPDTPYTSGRVLHDVRVEMTEGKKERKDDTNDEEDDRCCGFLLKV